MDINTNKKNTCVACGCPCEAHKEHNHPVGDKEEHKEEHVHSGGSCCN